MQYVPPRPSAVYCLPKQGFPDAYLRRTTNVITLRKPFDSNEEMHWEMELMRLREEKLLGEIERQRFLKEEARRELMLFEREMAIRGVAQSAGYPLRQPQRWGAPFSAAAASCPSPLPSPSPSPAVVVQSFHEWQKMEQVNSSDRLGFGAVALPPRIQPLMVEDKKEHQVLEADKRELIVLEKPDPNIFREKRKAETTSPSTDDVQPSGVKKTSKDEWSCALCEVTVSNVETFNQHLRGKKHKRKEAGLMARKESKVSQTVPEPLAKRRRKRRKVMEMLSSASGAEAKESTKHEETLQGEKTEGRVDMNALIPNFLKLGDKEYNKQQNSQIAFGRNSIISNDIVAKKKFNFWCEKCKVGAYDTEVMFSHVNGKKHQTNLKEAGQTGTGQPL